MKPTIICVNLPKDDLERVQSFVSAVLPDIEVIRKKVASRDDTKASGYCTTYVDSFDQLAELGYRLLEADETIQKSDEYFFLPAKRWRPTGNPGSTPAQACGKNAVAYRRAVQ